MGTLIIKDFRPLLFLRLSEKYKKGELTNEDLLRMKDIGISMTLNYSQKYYASIYEAHLQQSFFSVLGVINLGLVLSENKTCDFLGLFRIGWTRISKTAKLIFQSGHAEKFLPSFSLKNKTGLERIEMIIAERLSINPRQKEIWDGEKILAELDAEYQPKLTWKEFEGWIVKKHYNKESFIPAEYLIKLSHGTVGNISSTFCASLLINENPNVPLNRDSAIRLAHIKDDDETIKKILFDKISAYKQLIPKNFHEVLPNVQKNFLEKIKIYKNEERKLKTLADKLAVLENLFLIDTLTY